MDDEVDYGSKGPSAGRMGKATEYLVAATCILTTRGELNVSTSLVDDEGVDLVFNRRNSTSTLAVQVKARMSDSVRVASGGLSPSSDPRLLCRDAILTCSSWPWTSRLDRSCTPGLCRACTSPARPVSPTLVGACASAHPPNPAPSTSGRSSGSPLKSSHPGSSGVSRSSAAPIDRWGAGANV